LRKLLSFFRRKPLKRCEHKWYHVQDDFILGCFSGSVEADSACHIYCPKCKSKDLVYREEWYRIKRIQDINEEYARLAVDGDGKVLL
jgi:hypothetical protein